MIEARCNCGALAVEVPGPSELIVACHCTECQRRTGAPFGVGAFYASHVVKITGASKEFVRDGSTGGKVLTYFCPNCGSTVYWKAEKLPTLIGVAVGSFADSSYPRPARSVWEQSKHSWVQIDGDQHFLQGSIRSGLGNSN
jgi:hypothetical protein